jgi:FtsP/CotA-like multicopper oxidase with cupredoxin domain
MAAWMYNGQFPGPTLVATKGDGATITLQNQLPQPSITHWHGMLVAHEDDGHPGQALATGGGYSYDFTVSQRACLNWYHPHPHLLTGEQVYRGLAGAFIVRDAQDTGSSGNSLSLPHGAYEAPLIIRDATFDSRGNLSFGNKSSGFFGNVPLVNGTLQPFLPVDQAIYRFRVLNGCNARVLRLALTNGHQFTLIGNDGGLLETAVPALAEITLGPGERLDLVVDFRSLAREAIVMLRCLDAAWDLLQFTGTGKPGGDGALPSGALSTIDPLGAPVTVRRFSFDGMTRINGKTYAMERVDFEVPFDQTERWVFVTNGNGPHPVHVHGAYFQVQSRTGGRGQLFPWERGWKDTVLVADGETVEVLIRFTAHRGLYVMHCHQLAHEDNGMMTNFMVV